MTQCFRQITGLSITALLLLSVTVKPLAHAQSRETTGVRKLVDFTESRGATAAKEQPSLSQQLAKLKKYPFTMAELTAATDPFANLHLQQPIATVLANFGPQQQSRFYDALTLGVAYLLRTYGLAPTVAMEFELYLGEDEASYDSPFLYFKATRIPSIAVEDRDFGLLIFFNENGCQAADLLTYPASTPPSIQLHKSQMVSLTPGNSKDYLLNVLPTQEIIANLAHRLQLAESNSDWRQAEKLIWAILSLQHENGLSALNHLLHTPQYSERLPTLLFAALKRLYRDRLLTLRGYRMIIEWLIAGYRAIENRRKAGGSSRYVDYVDNVLLDEIVPILDRYYSGHRQIFSISALVQEQSKSELDQLFFDYLEPVRMQVSNNLSEFYHERLSATESLQTVRSINLWVAWAAVDGSDAIAFLLDRTFCSQDRDPGFSLFAPFIVGSFKFHVALYRLGLGDELARQIYTLPGRLDCAALVPDDYEQAENLAELFRSDRWGRHLIMTLLAALIRVERIAIEAEGVSMDTNEGKQRLRQSCHNLIGTTNIHGLVANEQEAVEALLKIEKSFATFDFQPLSHNVGFVVNEDGLLGQTSE